MRLNRSQAFQISIRAALSLGVVAVVLLTAAIVHIPWSIASRTNIADLNARLDSQVIRSIADKVDALLNNAVSVNLAIATNLKEGVIDLDEAAKRDTLFLSFLLSQPSLSAIEFGWPDDHSFVVHRVGDDAIRIEETIPGDSVATLRTRIFRTDKDGMMVLSRSEMGNSDYRVTQQFWYRSAFDVDMPLWSNIFRLPASGVHGVATTKEIEREGSLLGVVGTAISLDRLSTFLDGIETTPGGSVFLTNRAKQLVAVQTRLFDGNEGSGRPVGIPRLEEVAAPAVQIVADALKANNVDVGTLEKTRLLTIRDDKSGGDYFVTLSPLMQMGLVVAVVIPEADILGAINRNNAFLVVVVALFVAAVVVMATLIARNALGLPLTRVAANLKQLEDFHLDRVAVIPSWLSEVRQVSAATVRMGASLASFNKYIPTELVRTLFAEGIEAELGGERRELTILFMDIANFTAISENLGDGIIDFLGNYLSEMSSLIQSRHGTIDKYIGDAIMAFWGAPVRSDRHAVDACRAAIDCRDRLAVLRFHNREGDMPVLRVRIGLNTGGVLVGNVGSRDRLNYTVIGDPVNVASRLEALNKVYGTDILIGENTYAQARDQVLVRPLDRVAVYGKEIGLEIFELLAMRDGDGVEPPDWVATYVEGRAALYRREWDRAIFLFDRTISLRGGRDDASSVQIARAEAFKITPPPIDWDGLVAMDAK